MAAPTPPQAGAAQIDPNRVMASKAMLRQIMKRVRTLGSRSEFVDEGLLPVPQQTRLPIRRRALAHKRKRAPIRSQPRENVGRKPEHQHAGEFAPDQVE